MIRFDALPLATSLKHAIRPLPAPPAIPAAASTDDTIFIYTAHTAAAPPVAALTAAALTAAALMATALTSPAPAITAAALTAAALTATAPLASTSSE